MANNDLHNYNCWSFCILMALGGGSAQLHFSHEVWNALHVKWDWPSAVVPTKSTSVSTVFIKNLIYAGKKSNIYAICDSSHSRNTSTNMARNKAQSTSQLSSQRPARLLHSPATFVNYIHSRIHLIRHWRGLDRCRMIKYSTLSDAASPQRIYTSLLLSFHHKEI